MTHKIDSLIRAALQMGGVARTEAEKLREMQGRKINSDFRYFRETDKARKAKRLMINVCRREVLIPAMVQKLQNIMTDENN